MQGSCAELKDCSVCLSNLMALTRPLGAASERVGAHNASTMVSKAAVMRSGRVPVKPARSNSRLSRVKG